MPMGSRPASPDPLWLLVALLVWLISPSAGAAGDVAVRVEGGDCIKLIGDREDNEIQVLETDGQVEVRGVGATAVDLGMTGVDAASLDKLTVKLGAGNDSIQLSAGIAIQSGLRIATGSGDDRIEILGGVVHGRSSISSGSGDDVIELGAAVFEARTTLSSGAGADAAAIGMPASGDCFAPKFNDQLRVAMGGGDDVLTVECYSTGQPTLLRLVGGSGLDDVSPVPEALESEGVVVRSFERSGRQLPYLPGGSCRPNMPLCPLLFVRPL
jgi:hypothetical protein